MMMMMVMMVKLMNLLSSPLVVPASPVGDSWSTLEGFLDRWIWSGGECAHGFRCACVFIAAMPVVIDFYDVILAHFELHGESIDLAECGRSLVCFVARLV